MKKHLRTLNEKNEDCNVNDTKNMLHLIRIFLTHYQIIINYAKTFNYFYKQR